jgi:hypothetical protein
MGKLRDEEELGSDRVASEQLELLRSEGLVGYPSHLRPVAEHFMHSGFPLSHLIRLILWYRQLGNKLADI